MDDKLQRKVDQLYVDMEPYDRIAVAFSGGVDSTLLLYLLGQRKDKVVVAMAVFGPMMPLEEQEACLQICRDFDMDLKTLSFDPLKIEAFSENRHDRCYHCKQAIFSLIKDDAAAAKLDVIVDGTNIDDLADYRPGLKALEELKIVSPFARSGMTKADIYALSRYYGLPTASKPAMACLASRIPTGWPITSEKLATVAQGEAFLNSLGLKQYRLRHLGESCRIECGERDFEKIIRHRIVIISHLGSLGFKSIHLDLMGYRQGSMNQVKK